MPNSEWIKPGVDALVRVECISGVKTAGDNCGDVYIKHPWGERWFPAHALLPAPSPTDAAVIAARDRVVEAAGKWEAELTGIPTQDELDLFTAVREWRALTAQPRPPLVVALEALRKHDEMMRTNWGDPNNMALSAALTKDWNRIRAAIRDLEAAIKGNW